MKEKEIVEYPTDTHLNETGHELIMGHGKWQYRVKPGEKCIRVEGYGFSKVAIWRMTDHRLLTGFSEHLRGVK